MLEIRRVVNPTEVVLDVGGTGPPMKLAICTGTALLPFFGTDRDDSFAATDVFFDLQKYHPNLTVRFDPATTAVTVSVGPTSITGTDAAADLSWAVDAVQGTVGASGRVVVTVRVAKQGDLDRDADDFTFATQFSSMAYQVAVKGPPLP